MSWWPSATGGGRRRFNDKKKDEIVWQKDPSTHILLEEGPSRIIKGLTTVVGAHRMTDDRTGRNLPSLST